MDWTFHDFSRCFFNIKGVGHLFSLKGEDKKTKIAIFVILAVYMVLCFISFAVHGDSALLGNFETFDNDDVKYLRSAWTLIETGKYTYRYPDKDTVFIMPGITTVLAVFVALFGKYPLLQFKVFQALLGAASLYLIFLIGRQLFSSIAGLVAAFLMCIYAPSIYITNIILTEGCFYFLFLMLFLFTIHAVQTGRWKYYIGGGLFLGLAALFRPFIISFPIVVFIMWLTQKYPPLQMVKLASVVIAIVCLILSPWIMRNFILFGEFVPLTKSSGNPALQGTFINYDQSVREEEGIDYYNIIKETTDIDLELFDKDEIVTDAVEREMVKIRFREVIKNEPFKYLYWYTIGKTIKNWDKPFLWLPLYGIKDSVWIFQHYIMLIGGVMGFLLYLFSKNKTSLAWIVAAVPFFFNCMHLPFYCFSRYMFPTIFCFAVFMGYIFEYFRKKKVLRS